jgi:hypothetical protein
MSAFRVGLGGGRDLVATHVPGRKKPYLGIQQGSTFLALAQFISDDDMEALYQALQSVVVLPINAAADEVTT